MGVVGVVLAAGESRRMGRLKALLPFGNCTVIERVIQPLLQVELAEVAVVLGHRAAEIAAVLSSLPVRLIYNAHYRDGMTTSVQAALREITPVPEAYVLALVDQPLIAPGVLQQLLVAYRQTYKGIVVPTFGGKRGHPLLLAATYRQEVLALSREQGLHVVTRGHPDDTLEVPMASDDILYDMDYPQEYEDVLRRWRMRTDDGGGTDGG